MQVSERVDALTAGEVIAAVNQIRRSELLSYQQLAAEISRAAGERIDHSVLLRAFSDQNRKPHDRTIEKCRRFLAARGKSKRSKR